MPALLVRVCPNGAQDLESLGEGFPRGKWITRSASPVRACRGGFEELEQGGTSCITIIATRRGPPFVARGIWRRGHRRLRRICCLYIYAWNCLRTSPDNR